jgi:hypothetical protein
MELPSLSFRNHLEASQEEDSGQNSDTENDPVEADPVIDKADYIREKSILLLEGSDDSEKNDGNHKVELFGGGNNEKTSMTLNDNLNKSVSSLIPPSYYEEELVFSQAGDIELQGPTNVTNEGIRYIFPSHECVFLIDFILYLCRSSWSVLV